MKSTRIYDVMVQDHNRLMKYLHDVQKDIENKAEHLLETFQTFEWNLEKHFFTEERAIFSYYNPEKIDESFSFFSDISKQHTRILEHTTSIKEKIKLNESVDIQGLYTTLLKHKSYEEEKIYPKLDQELQEGEKRFIIERIQDIHI